MDPPPGGGPLWVLQVGYGDSVMYAVVFIKFSYIMIRITTASANAIVDELSLLPLSCAVWCYQKSDLIHHPYYAYGSGYCVVITLFDSVTVLTRPNGVACSMIGCKKYCVQYCFEERKMCKCKDHIKGMKS